MADAVGFEWKADWRPLIWLGHDFSEPDAILLHLDSGLWGWQLSSAPQGVHGSVGVYIERSAPEDDMEMVDYWIEKEA